MAIEDLRMKRFLEERRMAVGSAIRRRRENRG